MDQESQGGFETIQSFIATARALYMEDGISDLSDHVLQRFLSSRQDHKGKALEALAETLAWRKKFRVQELLTSQDFAVHMESGYLQWFGRDMEDHPVLVCCGSRLSPPKTEADIEKIVRYFIFFLEDSIRRGQLNDSKITVIIDRNGTKLDKNELKVASTLVPLLQKHYPDLLHAMYVFPTNTFFWMTWKVFKMYIDPKTISKIQLKEKETCLAEIIPKDNLFIRYGGTAIDPFEPEAAIPTTGTQSIPKQKTQSSSSLTVPSSPLKKQQSSSSSSSSCSNISLEGLQEGTKPKSSAISNVVGPGGTTISSKKSLTDIKKGNSSDGLSTNPDSPSHAMTPSSVVSSATTGVLSPLPALPQPVNPSKPSLGRTRQESLSAITFSFGKKNAQGNAAQNVPVTEEVWVAPEEFHGI